MTWEKLLNSELPLEDYQARRWTRILIEPTSKYWMNLWLGKTRPLLHNVSCLRLFSLALQWDRFSLTDWFLFNDDRLVEFDKPVVTQLEAIIHKLQHNCQQFHGVYQELVVEEFLLDLSDWTMKVHQTCCSLILAAATRTCHAEQKRTNNKPRVYQKWSKIRTNFTGNYHANRLDLRAGSRSRSCIWFLVVLKEHRHMIGRQDLKDFKTTEILDTR